MLERERVGTNGSAASSVGALLVAGLADVVFISVGSSRASRHARSSESEESAGLAVGGSLQRNDHDLR